MAENAGTADLTVSVVPTPEAPFTVELATSNGSALAGEDYDAVTTTVSFGIGDTTQTVTVPIINDVVTEAAESFTVTLSSPTPNMLTLGGSNVPVLADDTASVTISANDELSVGLEPASVAVIGQPNTYTVSLMGGNQLPPTGSTNTLTVAYNIAGSGSSAAQTGDFMDTSGGSVTIMAGSSSADIQIDIPPEATENRQFTITLGALTLGAGITGALNPVIASGQGSQDITIRRGFVVTVADVTAAAEGGTADLTVSVTPTPEAPFTINLATGDSGDSAIAGEDYDAVTTTVNFDTTGDSQMVSVPITDDVFIELDESFTVTLSAPPDLMVPLDGADVPVITDDTASVTISANDPLEVGLEPAPRPQIGRTIDYRVSLGENRLPPTGDVDSLTVSYTISGTGDNPAQVGEDLNGPPDAIINTMENNIMGSVTIEAGSSSAVIQIEIPEEAIEDRQFSIALGAIAIAPVTFGEAFGTAFATFAGGGQSIAGIEIVDVDVPQRTQAMENTLAVFGRSVAGDLVRMMEARTSSARSASQGGSQAIIGGRKLSADWLRSALSGKKAAATGGDTSTGGTTIADGDGNTVAGAPALVGGETTALGGGDFVTGAGGLATDGDTSAELSSIQPTVALVRDGLSMVGLNVGETGVSYHSVDLRRLLAGSSFQLALNGEGGQAGSWTVWGRGSITNFDGRPGNDFSVDGDMFSGQIGIDTHVNANMLAGLAVNYSEGDSDYDFTGGTRGNIETELTSVHPYVQWSGESGLDLWVMLGYGEGDATLEDDSGAVETDLDMKMAAAGVRRDVDKLGYLDWALKADVFFMRLEADERVDMLNAVEADTWQLRLALEGSKDLVLDGDASMKGVGEIGWRLDGGDAETGMGIEIGGGLDYANPNAGITVNARGHYLLAHRDSDFDEWGASISASFDPGVVGRGLRLSLTPTLGAASGGADRLWEDNSLIESAVDNLDDSVTPDMTMGAEAAYGMAVMNDRGLFTPFSELSWSDQNSRTRLGARMELLMPSRMDIGFAFYGEQEYRAGAADGVSGVLESRVRRSFAHDMGVIDLFGKMQSGTSDDYQIGVETKLNF